MKTEVLMQRVLFGEIVRQNNQTGFICANDIVAAGNKYRALNSLKLFDFRAWMDSKGNKEFIEEMKVQYGEVVTTKKGRDGSTWLHPYICIDLALSIDPKLKIEVYKWLFDELLKFRNDSGDSYKLMCGFLFDNYQSKTTFHKYIPTVATQIQLACKVKDWQLATEDQLRLRDKIHNNIALLSDVLRDNEQAVRLGILKSI